MIHRGTYDGTIYHNPVNRFCIISVKTADKEVPQEARSTRRYKDHLIRFVATGYELPRTDAVELELDGEWTKGKYGVQLQVEQWREIVPKTRDGVEGYYTLEIEPDGTVRQKRTLFDRQYEDIEQATEFLLKWQKVIAARLTGRDLKLAERSRELRKEEFIQMRKDRVIIHTGHLAGRLLADVLLADLMENTEVMQPQALPAAA